MKLTKLYLASLGAFILGFFIIFISPLFTGGSYSYAEAKMNEYQTLSNSLSIAMVKKEFNPKKQIMRMDFSIEETSTSNSSISNIKYKIISQYIKDRNPLEVRTTKVNDNYLVVIVKGIPEGYSVLSTTIIPKYIHPELQKTNDLEDRSVKMYVNENDKIVNNNLKIESNNRYQEEYIAFQQESYKKDIKENMRNIKTNNLAIEEINKQINELESEMQYQTDEEKLQTTNKINSNKTLIQQYEDKNEELNQTINELTQKIQLLEEKRQSL